MFSLCHLLKWLPSHCHLCQKSAKDKSQVYFPILSSVLVIYLAWYLHAIYWDNHWSVGGGIRLFCFILLLRQSLSLCNPSWPRNFGFLDSSMWLGCKSAPLCLVIEGSQDGTYVFFKMVLPFLGHLFYHVIFAKQPIEVLIEILSNVD